MAVARNDFWFFSFSPKSEDSLNKEKIEENKEDLSEKNRMIKNTHVIAPCGVPERKSASISFTSMKRIVSKKSRASVE